MTDAGRANDKCCGGKICRTMRPMGYNVEAAHKPGEEDCKNYAPKMKFAGFGRAYVPQQKLCELFSAKEGFVVGTIFPELYIPYEGNVLRSHNFDSEEGDNFA